jgi:hypothetical protein
MDVGHKTFEAMIHRFRVEHEAAMRPNATRMFADQGALGSYPLGTELTHPPNPMR